MKIKTLQEPSKADTIGEVKWALRRVREWMTTKYDDDDALVWDVLNHGKVLVEALHIAIIALEDKHEKP